MEPVNGRFLLHDDSSNHLSRRRTRGRILGARGCRETPPIRSAWGELMDTELIATDSSLAPPSTLDAWMVPPHTLPGEVVVVAGTGEAMP